jgi:hypothetical protein
MGMFLATNKQLSHRGFVMLIRPVFHRFFFRNPLAAHTHRRIPEEKALNAAIDVSHSPFAIDNGMP